MQQLLVRRADRRSCHRRSRRAPATGHVPRRTPTRCRRVDAACPFCPGHEHETPPEVARVPDPARPTRRGGRCGSCRTSTRSSAAASPGAHEVVVLSPAHDADFGALSPSRRPPTCCSRCATAPRFHLAPGCRYVQAFVNQGKAAGASIEHPHAQLVALDFVPRAAHRSASIGSRLAALRRRPGTSTWSTAPCSRGARPARRAVHGPARARRRGARFDEATDAEARRRRASRSATRSRRSAGARRPAVQRRDPHRAARPCPPVPLVGRIVPRAHRDGRFRDWAPACSSTSSRPRTAAARAASRYGEDPGRDHDRRATRRDLADRRADRAPHRLDGRRRHRSASPAQRRGVGTEFDCLTRVGPFRLTDRMTVTEWEPGRTMGIKHRGVVTGPGPLHAAPPPGRADPVHLERAADGSRGGWAGAVGAHLAKPVLRAIWRRNLRRLKAIVEAA